MLSQTHKIFPIELSNGVWINYSRRSLLLFGQIAQIVQFILTKLQSMNIMFLLETIHLLQGRCTDEVREKNSTLRQFCILLASALQLLSNFYSAFVGNFCKVKSLQIDDFERLLGTRRNHDELVLSESQRQKIFLHKYDASLISIKKAIANTNQLR